MATGPCPRFLYAQTAPDAGTEFVDGLLAIAGQHGGIPLAAAAPADTECLEAGTPRASCAILQFDDSSAVERTWSAAREQGLAALLSGHDDSVVLDVPGLPYEGLPDALEIPTVASVQPPRSDERSAYMVIQGNVFDQGPIDQYVGIIMPMIKAGGAYYIAFDLNADSSALHGTWGYRFFAISRWPNHRSGHDFWDSDRYQNEAIPQRQGAGEFTVHYFVGEEGAP